MASLLSQAQKTAIDSALDLLHDTFNIEIYIYVDQNPVYSIDAGYNALYGRTKIQSKSSLDKSLTKYPFPARVKYNADQKERAFEGNLVESLGQVRIKVKKDAYEMIKIASKIEIDEVLYVVVGDPAIEGIFSNNYYTIYLNREN